MYILPSKSRYSNIIRLKEWDDFPTSQGFYEGDMFLDTQLEVLFHGHGCFSFSITSV